MAQLMNTTFFFSTILCYLLLHSISCAHNLCHPKDSLSLLQFKEEMLDVNTSTTHFSSSDDCSSIPYPKMISWNKSTTSSSDCCTWEGVTCHGITGRVIGLDLSCSKLTGVVHENSSLFRLSYLQKLNLAFNTFDGSNISPNLVGGLSRLTHLNLSSSNFQGIIPSKLSHLFKLVLLDLSRSPWYNSTHLRFDTPRDFKNLIHNLTHLRVLSLQGVNISSTLPTNWSSSLTNLNLGETRVYGSLPNSMFHLSKLVGLRLSFNDLTGHIPAEISNLPNLRELLLNGNSFTGEFPSQIGNLSELSILYLGGNSLSGPLPYKMSSRLQKLRVLRLGSNELKGTIPSWLFSMSSLEVLHLNNNHFTGRIKEFITTKSFLDIDFSGNQLDGPIPDSVSQLVNLSGFDVSSNNLSGSISFSMFAKLNQLSLLGLSNNKLSFDQAEKEGINISLPYLSVLELSSCEITEFPYFLSNSKNLRHVQLSNNKIHGQIPNWIPWTSLRCLNLSRNSLSGLSISFNNILPWENISMQVLDLTSNKFQEPLPLSLCSFKELIILDLSFNSFTGSIPECFGNISNVLKVLNLAKNRLKGDISMTFPKDNELMNLNLNGNFLKGPLPRSLAYCKSLQVLDIGNNEISDTFPTFLENLTELQVFILKSNRFSGSIRNFKNENVRVFDLSLNEFTGALTVELFKSFKAMATIKIDPNASYFGRYFLYIGPQGSLYQYSASLVIKGQTLHFQRILTTFVAIDLSSNNFTGEIPEIIGNLHSLIVLNLSRNKFSGNIPSAFGELSHLESLDLSWNQIEGQIPQQLTDLTFLGFLNLSQNHLVGRIPQGKQFNTFLNNSYYGNSGLCGIPVNVSCGQTDQPLPPYQDSDQGDVEDSSFLLGFTWKSVLIGYSFGVAIGCVLHFLGKPKWLVRSIEEMCWYGLFLLGVVAKKKKEIKFVRASGKRAQLARPCVST